MVIQKLQLVMVLILIFSHVGKSCLQGKVGRMKLNEILYVPDMAKNLLSIFKVTRDNNVLFEFHSDFCLVKDKTTQ